MELYLKTGSIWDFEWDKAEQGWIYKTRQNKYRIFFDNCWGKQIWIGRYFEQNDKVYWCTYEDRIGAVKIDTGNCVIKFVR